MKKISIVLLILGFLISAGAVMAQEQPEEVALDEEVLPRDLDVENPTLLPDSPFYFVKSWSRGIQSFFAFDPVTKVELKQRFANEKLIEVKKMVTENKATEAVNKAVENYKKEVEDIGKVTEDIKEKAETNEKVASFLDKYIQQQTLHQRLLQKLEEQVPPDAFAKIQEARERHLEKFGEVMNRLEEDKEKMRERLEKNLEETKGSDFKEFKNLEVLKNLEEKAPEQAKEALQKARENTLKRLEIKMEQLPVERLEHFKSYAESISGAKERHEEILENLKERLKEKPALRQKVMEAIDRVSERVDIMERQETEKPGRICNQLWAPVCGKNGKTYSNDCFAKVAGVEINHKGACAEKNLCPETPVSSQDQTSPEEQPTRTIDTNENPDEATVIKKRMEAAQQLIKQLQDQLKTQD